ncbi:MAG: hypothetical protein CM15mP102_16730 [Flavobacteriales bacterium]|nr:MAG: hypothetical protein CM15mP102_16730 [Flavobacteriales bacterium]
MVDTIFPISVFFFDLTFWGDYYTNGSYGFNFKISLKRGYKYTGNFILRYENLINGERGLPGMENLLFTTGGSYSKDSKSSPNSLFSAS